MSWLLSDEALKNMATKILVDGKSKGRLYGFDDIAIAIAKAQLLHVVEMVGDGMVNPYDKKKNRNYYNGFLMAQATIIEIIQEELKEGK